MQWKHAIVDCGLWVVIVIGGLKSAGLAKSHDGERYEDPVVGVPRLSTDYNRCNVPSIKAPPF